MKGLEECLEHKKKVRRKALFFSGLLNCCYGGMQVYTLKEDGLAGVQPPQESADDLERDKERML